MSFAAFDLEVDRGARVEVAADRVERVARAGAEDAQRRGQVEDVVDAAVEGETVVDADAQARRMVQSVRIETLRGGILVVARGRVARNAEIILVRADHLPPD